MTPQERAARRAELLEQLGEAHYGWVDQHADAVDFQPARDSKPHNGVESDYSLHSLDRSATPTQEQDFQARTADIMRQLEEL